jgi:hypothetical protein
MKHLLLIPLLLLIGCSGFKITGRMCDTLQPGESVPAECRAYSEEEAEKASIPPKEEEMECPGCSEAEKLELRR